MPKLVLDNGVIIEEEKGISEAIVGYFCSLFQYAPTSNFHPFLQEIEPKVTNQMNAELTRPFSDLDAEQSLKQMKPLMAPGPDGMPPFFFNSYWSVVGNYVIEVVLSVLNTRVIPSNINHTFISLIPKIKSPTNPVSLCNAIYKIISKTIANCLKKIITKLVSKTQSAFTSDRLISNNILIAFETLHHLKNKRNGKSALMALKLDMNKAYDRVEWNFREKTMDRFGFDNKWISLICCCIQTVSFSIMVHGEPHRLIHPSRGLCQGDPLSPYLFLLYVEGLHALIQQVENSGKFLLFCQANDNDCQTMLDILATYEQASRQQINCGKTQFFF